MGNDLRKVCVICAWRGSCTKKFSCEEGGLHCPDFTEDIQLCRQLQAEASAVATEKDKI